MRTTEEINKHKVTKKIPEKVFEYVNHHFEGALLSKVEREMHKNGDVVFAVDACLDDIIYHLKFNKHGALLSNESEPMLEYYDDESDYCN